jgi:hypothetical protein
MRARTRPPRRPVVWDAIAPIVVKLANRLDRRLHWDRLWTPLGLLTLLGLRHQLRAQNLYDPDLLGGGAAQPPADGTPSTAFARRSMTRSIDGRGTHPSHVTMGAAGTRFARNLPVLPEVDVARSTPDPAEVSAALLQRKAFIPATSLNLLAMAWLQFEVHDWFAHKVDPEAKPLPPGLERFKRDPDAVGDLPIHVSAQTHWWDASQLYGADTRFAETIRDPQSDLGEVKVDDELLEAIASLDGEPADDARADERRRTSSSVPNLWLGLAIFHVAFAREHNEICRRLHEEYPDWPADRLFDQARMINAAVMAKIHTVEWTPALIAHPTTIRAIRSAWWGLLGERFRKRFGRIGSGEILSGIPGSWMDDDVPYALTEEFTAVYRMHPLLPDDVTFHHAADGRRMDLAGDATMRFEELLATSRSPNRVRERFAQIGAENAWYSLAIGHPGALTLHNHPVYEPQPEVRPGIEIDLGTADILRTRECGVPRYNEFRRGLRMPAAPTFRDLTDGDLRLASELKAVYDDVEDVDLLVGLLADRKPAGFAISDTSFRIFLLMAARRLRSDRFFTADFTPEAYTKLGMDWIEQASMADILRRHYPRLEPALRGVDNVFQPWPVVAGAP